MDKAQLKFKSHKREQKYMHKFSLQFLFQQTLCTLKFLKLYLIQNFNFLFLTERSKLNNESQCTNLGKHLSKSASELSCRDCSMESPTGSPVRGKNATTNPAVAGVIQKTHGFFSTLRVSYLNLVRSHSR